MVTRLTEQRAKSWRPGDTVRALRHRNFRIFFFGILVSFVGVWMQNLAQSWLVYRLTGSAWLLGLIGFAGQAPILLLAPLAGVYVDRHSRQRLVMLTQLLAMIQAFLLAALTLAGAITVGAIFALATALGVVNAFDVPARQSFMVELVGKEDLMNAIALNSSVINGARIIGPALAGLVVASFGEGPCFLFNGLSYLVVIAALIAMEGCKGQDNHVTGSTLSNLKAGFQYVAATRPIRALLLMVTVVSLFGLPYLVLLPIFADEILGGGPRGLGLLMGSAGVGALGGALSIAARRQVKGLASVVGYSVAALGVLLVAFSLSRNLLLSTLIIAPIGFALMLQLPATNTLLQAIVADHMRGRAMSFYSMCLIGVAPFGSLLAGFVASRVGAPRTLAAGGLLCLIGATVFIARLPALVRDGLYETAGTERPNAPPHSKT